MNPFVNPKKRGFQLQKGCKDLMEVLQGSRTKCEYCNSPPVALSIFGREDYRWCRECQRDLKDFAARQDFKFDFDINDHEAIALYHAKMQKEENAFMRQRVKERKRR